MSQLRSRRDDVAGNWNTAALSPDGQTIAAVRVPHAVTLWDANTAAEQLTLTPNLGSTRAVRFLSDGKSLVTGDQSGAVTLWRIPPVEGSRVLEAKGFRVAVSPNGRQFATTNRQRVEVFDVTSNTPRWSIQTAGVVRLQYSPVGDWLAGVGEGGNIHLWNATSGDTIARRSNKTGGDGMVFLDDGRLAFSSGDSAVTIWNSTTDESFELDSGGRGVLSLDVSPDGKRLAVGHGVHPLPDKTPPGKVVVWDLDSRRQVAVLKGHESFGVYEVKFSPDGRMLASAGGGLILWDTNTLEQTAVLSAHTGPIWSVAFTQDSRTLASGSMDNTIRLWDPSSGEQRLLLTGHPSWVTSVEFSATGDFLISASFDNMVRLWPVLSSSQPPEI